MSRRIKSLQLRLTIELAALFLVASCLAIGGLIYSASLTAGSLADRELGLRAEDLARHVFVDQAGRPRLDLPAGLRQAYDASAQQSLFAVRDKDGHLIEASTADFGAMAARWAQADSEPDYFQLSNFGPAGRDYAGVSIRLNGAVGPLSVLVAEASGGNQLVHSILREFVFDIAWYVPLFVGTALLLAAYSVRRGLRPLRMASARASDIGPGSISIRLPEAVPDEALPLVLAVNRALDRLEQGFSIQRQFTANAAHELRTPLTIITARLETLEGNGQLSALREEVTRMNRLVEQLLCVARLDSVALDVSSQVDLRQVAEEVVGSMAHLVLATGRTIALTGAKQPAVITGNAAAIADALRNLIENALAHTAPGTEVIVDVGQEGTLSVLDNGPGITAEDRPHVFDRFWRGRGVRTHGAGLGLAIVMEIAKAHGARVAVSDRSPHGARFDLQFRLA
jgi:signal transduction histidine kinase